jgi:predicted nucleic acid-binding protein
MLPRRMPAFGFFAKRRGRSAGVLDVMIAAHALARGVTLLSRDAAIKNLAIDGLTLVRW